MNWFERLFSGSGFMPHGFCYTWNPYVIWLNGASDALIALAYYTIPVTLVYFVRRRKDLAFDWMFLGFALFIVACGTTHAIELWSIWHPAYWLAGVVKLITAVVSIGTAAALVQLVPSALALPSPEDLRTANLALQEAQQTLRQANEELERRVAERTASLAAANAALRAEIEERERINEQQQEQAALLDLAPVLVRDMENRIVLWTDGAERLYGFSKAEALKRLPHELFDTQFSESREIVEETLRRDSKWQGELVRTKRNGEQMVVSSLQMVYCDSNAQPVRILEVNADVTQRKEAEAALRKSEQLFRQLAENISEVFWMRDLDHRQVYYVSPAYEKLWGRTCQSFYERPESWFEAIHSEDRDRVKQAALAGANYDEEFQIVRPDGTVRWVHDRAFRVFSAPGLLDRLVGMAQDITERKQAEAEKLHQREMHFRLMIEHTSDLITLLNFEGTIRFESPSLERVLGYSSSERLRSSVFEFIHPEDQSKAREAFKRARSDSTETVSLEFRCRHRNGEWRILQARGSTLAPEEGELLIVLNSRDVTEQKNLEAKLSQAQKMQAIGRLAGGVSHDFNNLLSVIAGHCALLEMSLKNDGETFESVLEIGRAAKRAIALTRQLLVFSRQQVIEQRILDLNAVISAAEAMLQRLIGEDVQLTTNLQPALSMVKADWGQIDQVLMNLAVNARDAMPAGGRLSMETRNMELGDTHPDRQHSRYVLLAVSDTGCGMTSEVRAHIFEPFFTTKAPGKGTGLGLAVTHGIIEQCGGFCEVSSSPSLGTTFKIYLPAAQAPDLTIEPEAIEAPRSRGEVILLVEDDKSVSAVTLRMLESLGYRVFVATSAEEALRLIKTDDGKGFDLLLTDVIMPSMSGRQLAEKIRSELPGMRVLYQSGYTDDIVIRHGILQEEVAFLQKPFSMEGLARKVREILDKPAC